MSGHVGDIPLFMTSLRRQSVVMMRYSNGIMISAYPRELCCKARRRWQMIWRCCAKMLHSGESPLLQSWHRRVLECIEQTIDSFQVEDANVVHAMLTANKMEEEDVYEQEASLITSMRSDAQPSKEAEYPPEQACGGGARLCRRTT